HLAGRRAAGDGRPERALAGDHLRGRGGGRRAGGRDGGGRGDDRRAIRGVRRAAAGARAAPGRHRGDGQPVLPHGGGGAAGGRGGRVPVVAAAAGQPRPQTHRESPQQNQGASSQGGEAGPRGVVGVLGRGAGRVHPRRVPQLLPELRLSGRYTN